MSQTDQNIETVKMGMAKCISQSVSRHAFRRPKTFDDFLRIYRKNYSCSATCWAYAPIRQIVNFVYGVNYKREIPPLDWTPLPPDKRGNSFLSSIDFDLCSEELRVQALCQGISSSYRAGHNKLYHIYAGIFYALQLLDKGLASENLEDLVRPDNKRLKYYEQAKDSLEGALDYADTVFYGKAYAQEIRDMYKNGQDLRPIYNALMTMNLEDMSPQLHEFFSLKNPKAKPKTSSAPKP